MGCIALAFVTMYTGAPRNFNFMLDHHTGWWKTCWALLSDAPPTVPFRTGVPLKAFAGGALVNTYGGLVGSSAGDHQSWMFCSFNPSTSLGGGAMAEIFCCHPLWCPRCYLGPISCASFSTATKSCLFPPSLPSL